MHATNTMAVLILSAFALIIIALACFGHVGWGEPRVFIALAQILLAFGLTGLLGTALSLYLKQRELTLSEHLNNRNFLLAFYKDFIDSYNQVKLARRMFRVHLAIGIANITSIDEIISTDAIPCVNTLQHAQLTIETLMTQADYLPAEVFGKKVDRRAIKRCLKDLESRLRKVLKKVENRSDRKPGSLSVNDTNLGALARGQFYQISDIKDALNALILPVLVQSSKIRF